MQRTLSALCALALSCAPGEPPPDEIVLVDEPGVRSLTILAPGGGDVVVRAEDVEAVEITAGIHGAATLTRERDGEHLEISHGCPPEWLPRTVRPGDIDPGAQRYPYCYVQLEVVVPRRLAALHVETATYNATQIELDEVDELTIVSPHGPLAAAIRHARIATLHRANGDPAQVSFGEAPELLDITKEAWGVLSVVVPRGEYALELPPGILLDTPQITVNPASPSTIRAQVDIASALAIRGR